jgi:hypothetical protein
MNDIRMLQRTGRSTKLIALAFAAAIIAVTIARQRSTDPVDETTTAEVATARAPPVTQPGPATITTTPPREAIFRDADGIHIDARGMPRTQAVERLAALTRARIASGADLLALAPPLDLRWQGRDATEAWKRVLAGAGLRYGVACDASACTIRISSIDLKGGSVLVTEAPTALDPAATNPEPGLMNQPTDPDAIDETSLGP